MVDLIFWIGVCLVIFGVFRTLHELITTLMQEPPSLLVWIPMIAGSLLIFSMMPLKKQTITITDSDGKVTKVIMKDTEPTGYRHKMHVYGKEVTITFQDQVLNDMLRDNPEFREQVEKSVIKRLTED